MPLSYGYAITTYVGQNLGAKKYHRIRKGVRSGIYMALLTSIVISGVMVIIRTKYIVTVCIRRSGADKTGIGYCI